MAAGEGSINFSYAVEIYDIDLFNTSSATIQELQLSDKKVICYFSAGSYEDFREDKDKFLPEELGNTIDGSKLELKSVVLLSAVILIIFFFCW